MKAFTQALTDISGRAEKAFETFAKLAVDRTTTDSDIEQAWQEFERSAKGMQQTSFDAARKEMQDGVLKTLTSAGMSANNALKWARTRWSEPQGLPPFRLPQIPLKVREVVEEVRKAPTLAAKRKVISTVLWTSFAVIVVGVSVASWMKKPPASEAPVREPWHLQANNLVFPEEATIKSKHEENITLVKQQEREFLLHLDYESGHLFLGAAALPSVSTDVTEIWKDPPKQVAAPSGGGYLTSPSPARHTDGSPPPPITHCYDGTDPDCPHFPGHHTDSPPPPQIDHGYDHPHIPTVCAPDSALGCISPH